MRVPYDEGIANRIGPEPCAGAREGTGEALTGGRIGGVLSGVSYIVRGADAVVACRRQQGEVRHRKVLIHPASSLGPQHVRTSSAREPGYLVLPSVCAQGRVGKVSCRSR